MMKAIASRLAGGPDGGGSWRRRVRFRRARIRRDAARQRAVGSRPNAPDVDAEQIANHDGVVRRRFQRCVSRDCGDAEQIGMAGRNDHRDGVVVARVAVEDDGQTPTFGMMLVGRCHDHQSMPPLPSGRGVETMVGAWRSSR